MKKIHPNEWKCLCLDIKRSCLLSRANQVSIANKSKYFALFLHHELWFKFNDDTLCTQTNVFFFFLLLQNSLIWCRYNAWAHGKYFWFRIFFKSWALNTTHRKNLKTMRNFFLNTENESNEIKWCRRKNKINDVIGKWKKILGACMKRDCMKACGSSKVHETPSHSLR